MMMMIRWYPAARRRTLPRRTLEGLVVFEDSDSRNSVQSESSKTTTVCSPSLQKQRVCRSDSGPCLLSVGFFR
jgi:hypothetical protein